jgi:hypothetical protein
MSDYDYTEKQGQYLAFIHNYTVIHGEPPARTDMQRFFRVSPPSVHQMVLRLAEKGFISREPGQARALRVLVPPQELPLLRDPRAKHPQKKASGAPVYQIKVTLEASAPPIWRRILAPGDVTLERLHLILQVAMGWTDSHLHMFTVGTTVYGEPHPDYDFEVQDERRVRLHQIVPGEGFRFRYEYDLGDSWMHTLLVERVLEPGQSTTVCLAGERACPPEDVGGVWGYVMFLEAIRDPEHPEHQEYQEWIGSEFDPEAFDLEEMNAVLRGLG